MSNLEQDRSAPRRDRDRDRDRDVDPPRALADYDLVCLSHLRWDFVYQRPQHLLSRCARARRVFFVEEPVRGDSVPRLECSRRDCGVTVVVPHLPGDLDDDETEMLLRCLVDDLLADQRLTHYVLWYYTPMALGFTGHLAPLATVYDCMDELSAFWGAPRALCERERDLLRTADLVFTGGRSLYEAKRALRPGAHLFPSSIDVPHFRRARARQSEPPDQAALGRPRLGYFGVIDERIDLDLLAAAADLRPDFTFVMVGPVAKIDPAALPCRPNIHYLGQKPYAELPAYIAGWDVALMPFARNESTRFISPTKTPEYLASGRPVVATSIRDVVDPYGREGLVAIADTPADFVAAALRALQPSRRAEWLQQVDAFLARGSWDRTWAQMESLIGAAVRANRAAGSPRIDPCSTT
ncbi:glycosyltransferase family 1 protein [Nannocystis punicea]|uniref:Glycosyltransferase family 1 protein n=1 Tax=Nannocystis punicea TaxID=2995304 RepID=A0ABY7GUW1_9BACT|nr:glycosyltransferase family 1 protein [Nannocystis poenicansa]WAS90728.1 glycosyltransferase family 1 protein [Nannocystis poenicansa]